MKKRLIKQIKKLAEHQFGGPVPRSTIQRLKRRFRHLDKPVQDAIKKTTL